MRLALAVTAALLLCGCSGSAPRDDTAQDDSDLAPQLEVSSDGGAASPGAASETNDTRLIHRTWPVDFILRSDMGLCPVGRVSCPVTSASTRGHASMGFVNGTSLDLRVELDQAEYPMLAQRAQVVIRCVYAPPEDRFGGQPCPSGLDWLGNVTGTVPFDVRLSDVPLGPNESPRLHVEYAGAGDAVVRGANASYRFSGTYTAFLLE